MYREDLARVRENGWSLFGLSLSLQAQGKADAAAAARARFEKAWARADITLTSSRVLENANEATRLEVAPTMVHSIALPTGVTLQYAERGSQTGVPVIFLHGVSDSWRSFKHVLPLLPPTIRALAITARGHGDSGRPPSGYATATWPKTSTPS